MPLIKIISIMSIHQRDLEDVEDVQELSQQNYAKDENSNNMLGRYNILESLKEQIQGKLYSNDTSTSFTIKTNLQYSPLSIADSLEDDKSLHSNHSKTNCKHNLESINENNPKLLSENEQFTVWQLTVAWTGMILGMLGFASTGKCRILCIQNFYYKPSF